MAVGKAALATRAASVGIGPIGSGCSDTITGSLLLVALHYCRRAPARNIPNSPPISESRESPLRLVKTTRELPAADSDPIRFRILGEDLVAFCDTNGKVGFIQNNCPHCGASLFFGGNEEAGIRCVHHS